MKADLEDHKYKGVELQLQRLVDEQSEVLAKDVLSLTSVYLNAYFLRFFWNFFSNFRS